MKTKTLAIALIIAAIAAVGAYALPPSGAITAARNAVTALGPAFEDDFTHVCTTSPTSFTTRGMIAYTCQNNSASAVHVGGPSVNTSSPCHSTACPSAEWSAHSRRGYCRAASGTVTITCRALVSIQADPWDAGS